MGIILGVYTRIVASGGTVMHSASYEDGFLLMDWVSELWIMLFMLLHWDLRLRAWAQGGPTATYTLGFITSLKNRSRFKCLKMCVVVIISMVWLTPKPIQTNVPFYNTSNKSYLPLQIHSCNRKLNNYAKKDSTPGRSLQSHRNLYILLQMQNLLQKCSFFTHWKA